MESMNFSEAKAHLSEVVDRVESGESVTLIRHGKPVAKIVPFELPLKRIDFEALYAEVSKMPMSSVDSVDIIRAMRDESY